MNSGRLRSISIAILALGGEGGGVLANWIVDLAEHAGYLAQKTSVPGVAQRTGATIYYVELFPREEARKEGKEPVLGLMPMPGDVDIVLASELMEAARAVQRGFVTPDRTTLIASAHRVYAIDEKSAMGDGVVDPAKLMEIGRTAAKRFISFDMAKVASEANSIVSSVLLGALAGAHVLPFEPEDFRQAIRRSGVAGLEGNLAAFAAGCGQAERASKAPPALGQAPPAAQVGAPLPAGPKVEALLRRARDGFPLPAQPIVIEGIKRLLDYQDVAYASLYLDRLAPICQLDGGQSGEDFRLTSETARWLALWMSYDDAFRVADLKTRSARFGTVGEQARAASAQILHISDFLHPEVRDISAILPASLGRRVQASGWMRRIVESATRKGRIVRTTGIIGFSTLYALARMKRWRRATLRYKIEDARIRAWLDRIRAIAPADYELALEVAECQRLLKGYGDTYERGTRSFEAIMSAIDRLGARGDAALKVRELREAALADESGRRLEEALRKIFARF